MPESKFLKATPSGVAYASAPDEDTNSSTTPKVVLDKTAPALEEGDYLITAYAEGKTDTPVTSGCKIELLLDGVGRAESNIGISQWHHFNATTVVRFDEDDTPQVKLQFSRAGASATVTLRRAYLTLVPLAKIT